MPPTSKAIASAVESTLRRSSRRSVPSSIPSPRAVSTSASTSASAATPIEANTSSPAKLKRPRVKREPEEETLASSITAVSKRKASAKAKVKPEAGSQIVRTEDADEALPGTRSTAFKKRRTKKEVDEQDEIFPPRPSPHLTLSNGHHHTCDRRGSGLFIGAHISSAGGVENAPLNALRIGGNAFSCFVRPKMQWASTPISETSTESFKQRVVQHSFMPLHPSIKADSEALSPVKMESTGSSEDYGYVVPHGCYLVNLANPDESKREKSFEAFIDDLQRCERLGVKLFNFHPGSMTAASTSGEGPLDVGPMTEVRAAKAEACALVASYIDRAHSLTSSVVVLIENMAGSKSDTILGSSLRDLAAMIAAVKDKTRVGVCIDTCHAFAAGYDLTSRESYAAFAELIDTTVGWETVRAFHLNDSKFGLGCKRDRHANIGRGEIGLGGFWCIVNDDRWNGIPLILETPALGNAMGAYPAKQGTKKMHEVWNYQIQALYALRGTKWGEWAEAEGWLKKADAVVEDAERLYASKKGEKGSKKKTKKKVDDEDESDLSDDQ